VVSQRGLGEALYVRTQVPHIERRGSPHVDARFLGFPKGTTGVDARQGGFS
jgi:hypothetical protein